MRQNYPRNRIGFGYKMEIFVYCPSSYEKMGKSNVHISIYPSNIKVWVSCGQMPENARCSNSVESRMEKIEG